MMMDVTWLLYGATLAVALVLLGMCGMMYLRWKTQLYSGLVGGVGLVTLAMLGQVLVPDKFSSFYLFFLSLNTCGFIVIQIALFRLLHTKRNDKLYVYLAGTGCTLIVAAVSLFLPPSMPALLLLFIVSGVTLYSKFKLLADEGLSHKHALALVFYIISLGAYTVATMVNLKLLLMLSLLFMVMAFYMICMQLFERVIHIMQAAAYTSTRDDVTGLYTRKHFFQQSQQLLQRGHAYGVIYLLIDFSQEKNAGTPVDDRFGVIGPVVLKYCDRYGIACRYEQEGVALLVTKAAMELPNLCDSLKLNIEAEIHNQIATGYMEIENGAPLDDLLQRAREGAMRMKENGLDKIFDIEHSRILN